MVLRIFGDIRAAPAAESGRPELVSAAVRQSEIEMGRNYMEDVNLTVNSVYEAAEFLRQRFSSRHADEAFVLYLCCGPQSHRYSIRFAAAPEGGLVTIDPEGCEKVSCRLASPMFGEIAADTLSAGLDAHY